MKKPAQDIDIEIISLSLQTPQPRTQFAVPKSGKNALCPCGSGNKYKKCHGSHGQHGNAANSRSQSVVFTFGEPILAASLSVSLDPWTGRVQSLVGESPLTPKSVVIEHSYARDKGRKVITRAVADLQESYIDFERVLASYDLCFAVDTNTRSIRGSAVSVTGIVCGARAAATARDQPAFRYSLIRCLEFRDATHSPEKIGWSEVIRAHMVSSEYRDSQRYCVIVDAHLNDIEKINQRLEPIVDTLLLPLNFELAFATADVRGNVHNQMLRLADREASVILDAIENDPSDELLETVDSPHYKARRWWRPRA